MHASFQDSWSKSISHEQVYSFCVSPRDPHVSKKKNRFKFYGKLLEIPVALVSCANWWLQSFLVGEDIMQLDDTWLLYWREPLLLKRFIVKVKVGLGFLIQTFCTFYISFRAKLTQRSILHVRSPSWKQFKVLAKNFILQNLGCAWIQGKS